MTSRTAFIMMTILEETAFASLVNFVIYLLILHFDKAEYCEL